MERLVNDLDNLEPHLRYKQTPSDNHMKSEYVGSDWNSQGTLAGCPISITMAPSSLQTALESSELTEPLSAFDFYDNTPDAIQATRNQLAEPVKLELEEDFADEIPVYEVGESPERSNLVPSRPRRNVGPLKRYGESLHTDVIVQERLGTADKLFTLSEDMASDNISEI